MASPTMCRSTRATPYLMPSWGWTWRAATSPTTSWRSWPSEATALSPPVGHAHFQVMSESPVMMFLTRSVCLCACSGERDRAGHQGKAVLRGSGLWEWDGHSRIVLLPGEELWTPWRSGHHHRKRAFPLPGDLVPAFFYWSVDPPHIHRKAQNIFWFHTNTSNSSIYLGVLFSWDLMSHKNNKAIYRLCINIIHNTLYWSSEFSIASPNSPLYL